MSKITALRNGGGRSRKVRVFLDGRFAFSLEGALAAKEGLEVSQELSAEVVEALVRSDCLRRCLDTAVSYLSYRPRSEAELMERLRQRGFPQDVRTAVVSKLRNQGLVDDSGFAQFWRDSRTSSRPRSQWLVKLELRRKGVADEVVDRVVADVDDDDGAYRAALEKARRISDTDPLSFRHRLAGYLRRRGFSSGVIHRTLERVSPGYPAANCRDVIERK